MDGDVAKFYRPDFNFMFSMNVPLSKLDLVFLLVPFSYQKRLSTSSDLDLVSLSTYRNDVGEITNIIS